MTQDVVLVPGLWMPGIAMRVLGARLAARDYVPRIFSYRGRARFEDNVASLAEFVRRALGARKAHYIGHSLGGLLLLETLNRHPELQAASVLLLGAPVRGCLAGRRLARAAVGRWMMGNCQALWDRSEARWCRGEPLGVVAGTLPLGLGRALGRLPGVNDGVVCVDETPVERMSARALVPLGHSTLIFSARVAGLADRFMQSGRFD